MKGHAGEEGNEGADYLANVGATMGELSERDWDALIKDFSAISDDVSLLHILYVLLDVREVLQASNNLQSSVATTLTQAELEVNASQLCWYIGLRMF